MTPSCPHPRTFAIGRRRVCPTCGELLERDPAAVPPAPRQLELVADARAQLRTVGADQ